MNELHRDHDEAPEARYAPMLRCNRQTAEAIGEILGINPNRVKGVSVGFGNGIVGEDESGTTGLAVATIELILDDRQLRALTDLACDPDMAPKMFW